MASRRTVLRLAQTSAFPARPPTPRYVRVATPSTLTRRYQTDSQHRQPFNSSGGARRSFVPISGRLPSPGSSSSSGASVRRYSSERAKQEPAENKIWDFEALQKLITSPERPSITIIDVREPSELQETGRIPGAINIPIKSAPDSFHISDEEFEDRFGHSRPARDAEVVFYCKAGVRSRGAAGLAREAGWTNVGEYPGSWLDWFEKGGKVERNGER